MTVLGARPQFIKAAPVSRALREAGHHEKILHTGQHYDDLMSSVFFDEMDIPAPFANLNVGSGSHGRQTARMLEGVEDVLLRERPDHVLVYGDTNSTLAAALAAAKLRMPIAHVEAGLRSWNRDMPEEHNRVLTDHCSDFLFCPTATAVRNLAAEGITRGVHQVGDTMFDAVLQYLPVARERSDVLDRLGLEPGGYALATVHRAYNTDDPANLRSIVAALADLPWPVVFPVHPRTLARMQELGLDPAGGSLRPIEPLGYLDNLLLLANATRLLTDSGGMQKEAYFVGVPCITLRPETEWTETIDSGWNTLTGPDPDRIRDAVAADPPGAEADRQLFGDGHSADRIVTVLETGTALNPADPTRAH